MTYNPKLIFGRIGALLVAALLSACSAASPRVPLASEAAFDLMPGLLSGESLTVVQKVVLKQGERSYSFISQLELQPRRTALVWLSGLNTRAFSVVVEGGSVQVERGLFPLAEIAPERIMALLQIGFWPERDVAGHLRGEEWEFQASEKERRLLASKKMVVRTLRLKGLGWEGAVRIEDLDRGFSLEAETVEVSGINRS